MNGKSIILVTRIMDGRSESFKPGKHSAKKIAVKPGSLYLLKNAADNYAPENITLKRVGKDLQVFNEGDEKPCLILTNYFTNAEGSERAPVLLGMAEDGQLYQYIPLSGEGYETGYLMDDGQMTPIALGGQPMGAGDAFFTAQESDNELWPVLLGLFALAGAVGAGIAIARHNRDKDDTRDSKDTTAPVSKGIGGALDNTGSKTGPLASGDTTDETRPQLTGKSEPGSTIAIYDNGKKIGETVSDDYGNWSWTPDKPLGEGKHELTTTETDKSGNTSKPSPGFEINVDTTAPESTTPPTVVDNAGDKTGPLKNGDATDDTQPELSGKGEPGNVIDIWDNGDKIGSTVVDKDGNWTWKPEKPLPEGEHELSTTETDAAGNTSEPSPGITIEVDTTVPATPSVPGAIDNVGDKTGPLKDGDITDDTQPELSGKGDPGNVIDIWDNGDKIGSTVVDEEGNWSWMPEEPLPEGEHELSTTETDAAGNTSEPSPGITIEVDTTPPAGSTTPPTVKDDVGDVTGELASGDTTDDTQPELSGKGEPGNVIDIWDNGDKIGSTVVDEEGNWSWMPEEPLPEGEHELSTTETDAAGNTSEPSPGITIEVDTTPPTGSTTPPTVKDDVGDVTGELASGDTTDDTQPELSGKGDPGNVIDIWDNGDKIGSTVVDEEGNWSWMPEEPLPEGEHELSTTETDAAGNTSEPSPGITIEVDTTPPAGSTTPPTVKDDVGDMTGELADGDTTDDTQPELSGKGEPGNVIDIWDNGDKIGSTVVDEEGNWSWMPEEPLPEGEHELSTTETDAAGNTSEPSPGITIEVDTTPPTGSTTPPTVKDDVGDVTGELASGDTTDDTQPELSGKGEPGNVIDIWDNGDKIGSTVVDEEGNWSWMPEEPLPEGEHELSTTETDAAGNTSEPSPGITIEVDTTPPTGSTTPPTVKDDVGDVTGELADGDTTDDTQPELSGKGDPGNVIDIWDNGDKIGSTVVDEEGNWSWMPEEPLPEGEHELSTTETDAAGNTSEPSPGITIEVDTTPPNADALAITRVDDTVGEITGNIVNGGKTDDSRPTISGTGTAGDTLVLYTTDSSGKHEIGRVTVDASGNWSIQPENPLLAGENIFSAVEIDKAGNSATSPNYVVTLFVEGPSVPSIGSIVDNEGPITGGLQKGDVTDDNTPTLSGSAGVGDIVRIYDNGELIGSTKADESGNWSFTPSRPLDEGDHSLSVTAVDSVGMVSDPSGEFDFSVDTQAPAPVKDLTANDNEGDVQGPIGSGSTTDDATPTLKGSAEPGSTVNIYDDGKKIGEAAVGEDGTWSWTPDDSLEDGERNITVTVSDPAGNESEPSEAIVIVVDTVAPTAQITHVVDSVGSVTGNITPNGVTDDTRPVINGIAKANSVIKVYDGETLLGSTTSDASGNWSFKPVSELEPGSHNLTVTATDLAGNTSDRSGAFVFDIDTTSPVKPTIDSAEDDVGDVRDPLSNGSVTDDSTPTLHGTAEADSVVTIYDNGKVLGSVTTDSDGQWIYTPTTPLPEGEHHFTVTATDAAGNKSADSDEFVLTTDYTAPDASKLAITGVEDNVGEITGNILSGGNTDDNTPVITGTGTAGNTISIYTTVNGTKTLLGKALVDENGQWRLELDDSNALSGGMNSLTAVETDPAGNSTSPTPAYVINVYLPGDGPSAPSINSVHDNEGTQNGPLQKGSVTDDNTPTLSGTAGPGLVVRIYDDGQMIGSTVADSEGNWSFTTPVRGDGEHSFTADAVNGVGQVSPESGAWAIVVDTRAPEAVKDLEILDNVGSVTGPLKDGDTTDDNTPTLSGTAEPGSVVTVWDGDNKVGEAAVGDDGRWSVTPTLPEGDHSLSVSVTDAAGNESGRTPPVTITVDTSEVMVTVTAVKDNVGSVTGDVAANGVTDDARPELQGAGKAGSTVNIWDGSTLLGSTVVDGNGRWSFTPAADLADRTYTLTVNAKDTAGNLSESVNVSFTVDTQAPAAPAITKAEDAVGELQGELASGSVTDDPSPTLHGTAEAGSTVTIRDGDTVLGTVKADAQGKWSYTPTSTLPEGEHRFTVAATDAAGNESGRSGEFVLTTDYTAPDASKLAITGVEDNVGEITGNVAANGSTDDTTPVITGTGTAGDTIRVYTTLNGQKTLLGETMVDANGNWRLELDDSHALPAGNHQLTAVEIDPAGNSTSPTPAYNVTVVTGSPAAPSINTVMDNVGVTEPLQKGSVTDDNTPTLSGTAGPGLVVRIYDDGQMIGSTVADSEGNWSFTTPVRGDGEHSFTADAVNGVGQVSPESGAWAIVVDTRAPEAVKDLEILDNVGSVTGPLKDGDTTDDNTPTLSGTAEPGSVVTVWDGDNKVGEAAVGDDGRWSVTPTLPEGDRSLSVSVTDAAGNESGRTPPVTITVDTSEVMVTVTAVKDNVGSVTGDVAANGVTDDTRPELQGAGKAGSTVSVWDGSTLLGSTVVDGNGRWSFTPAADLADRTYTLTVNAKDTAGNLSESVNVSFTVDTQAPAAPAITKAEDAVGELQGELASGSVTDDPSPTLHGTAEAGSTVTIRDGDTVLGTVKADAQGKWSYTPTSTLPEGEHRFTVTATDAAGNESGRSGEFVLTTDYTAPDASKLAITGVEDNVGEITGNVAANGSTDDTTPVITGTGTAGDTIRVYTTLNGQKTLLGETTVDANGNWRLELDDSHALPAGNHQLTAVEIDPAGNSTSPTPAYNVTVVTGSPAAPSINTVMDNVGVTEPLQKGSVTDDNTPTLSGTAGPGLVVRIYDDGQMIGSTVADSEGNWSFTTPVRGDGEHSFTADAVNGVGQVSPESGAWAIVVDTRAPEAVKDLEILDNVGSVTGPLKDGDTTDDNTPTLSGTAEPGSVVTVWDGDNKVGETAVGDDGRWSVTPTLPEGDRSLSVSVTDAAGNESGRTPPVTITVDTSEVMVTVTAVKDNVGSVTGDVAANGVTDDARPELQGAGKAGSTVSVWDGSTLLGSTVVDGNGRWSFTPAADLADRTYTLTVNAKDTAGNLSESVNVSFTVDTQAPAAPAITKAEDAVGELQGELASGSVTDDPSPTLHGTAEAGSTVTIRDGDTVLGTVKADAQGKWSYTPTSTLPEGEHRFTVTATDAAGNESGRSGEFVLTTDYTAPDASKLAITGVWDSVGEVTGNVVSGGLSDDKQPAITGTGTAGDTIRVYTTLNGQKTLLGETTVDANGNWRLELDDSHALSEGVNNLTAVETDPAGNSTSPTPAYTVTIVPTTFDAPTIEKVMDNAGSVTGEVASGASTDDTTPTLSGTAVENSTVIIYNGDKELGRTTADSNGHWSWTVNPALEEGDYRFTAKAQSPAGQVSDASNVWDVNIDITAPNPVANLTITDNVGSVTGELTDGDTTDDSTPTLAGTAEAGSKVTIWNGNTILAEVQVGDNGSWSWEPATALPDNNYAFAVTVTDAAGNVSEPTDVVNITVDTQAPQVTLAIDGYEDNVGTNQGQMSVNDSVTDDVDPVLTGSWSGELGATESIRIYQDGVLLGLATVDRAARTWTYAVQGLENNNTYHFTATAVDMAGNETAISPEFALSIDLDAPTQTVTIDTFTDDVGVATGEFPSGTTTDDRNPTLKGKVSGIPLEDGDVIRIYDVASDTLLGTATVDTASNTWSFVLPPLSDDMTYQYKAVVADRAGNEGAYSDDFTISVNLTVNIDRQNTLDSTPIISGSTGFDIGEGEYVKVTVNGKTYSSENGQVVIDLRNNTWYVQIPEADALAVGTYDVAAVLYAKNGTKITEDDSRNELVIGATPEITFTAKGATSDDTGTAITISEDGTWRILSNSAVFTQNGKDSTALGSFESIVLSGIDRQQQSTFIDFDRDGLMDVLGADTRYANGQQSFKYNGETYTVFQVGAYGVAGETNNGYGNAYVWYGGAAGIDIDGDGYVDIVYGDETPNDANARGGYDTTFVMNTNGTVAGFTKSGAYIDTRTEQNGVYSTNNGNATPDREIATVDFNNDGYVDIVYHGTTGANVTSEGGRSTASSRLVMVENNRDASGNVTLTNTQIINGVFNGDNAANDVFTTLTWADLNGDGYMDLFVGGLTGAGTGGAQSVIYYNDGTGKFVSEADGVGTGNNLQTLGDSVNSMTSLAVDWNGDGRMDLIEIAGIEGSRDAGNAANVGLLWMNNGTDSASGRVNWSSSTILTDANQNGRTNFTTGAVLVDLDYDGDQDLVVFRAQGGKSEYIENTNKVSDGTSIIVRILDKNGVNAYYGNTVMLIDEATGKVVSSQIINTQGGVNMNNSTGLVYFYGLDATKTYSVVMLANGSDFGGVNAVGLNTGSNTIENVNGTWGGLKAVEANHAYTLTAESGANASSASTAASDGTNTVGIVGTGYNDTLYATAGSHIYNGGGGSVNISGVTTWSDIGGMDIVDYKLAGSTAITIDMNNTGYQNTGFGNAKFVNIEGIAGGSGNDTFIGNAANNFFEGRGGDDTFDLSAGGQDTLMYKVLSAANNGGNGQDTVIGFHVGTIEATKNADIIDISEMLIGYKPDADGAAHYINGVPTIDAGDNIKDFLRVTQSGNDTILSIDRDGTGSSYGMTKLITFKDTDVDLETLLANHQITLS
jgi:hypothetical protein